MPHRIMLNCLSAAVAAVALFAAVSVPVSAQAVKTQPAQKVQPTITQPTQPAQQPPQRTIMSIGGTYGPNGCDVNGQHYIINQTIDIEVREPGGKTHTVTVHCTSQGWST
jgi:hypothetical protein